MWVESYVRFRGIIEQYFLWEISSCEISFLPACWHCLVIFMFMKAFYLSTEPVYKFIWQDAKIHVVINFLNYV